MLSFHWEAKTEWIRSEANVSDDRFLLCWAGKWSDSDELVSARLSGREAKAQDDGRIVGKLADLIREADIVVAHNGARFDLKRLNARLVVHQLAPLGKVQMLDTLLVARQSFDLPYNSLDYLASKFGLGGKLSTSFDLWRRAYWGDVSALRELEVYNRQDVELLEGVFERMRPYAKSLPRLQDGVVYGQQGCPYCGSLEARFSGFDRSKVSTFRKFRCVCGREFRERLSVGSKKLGHVGL